MNTGLSSVTGKGEDILSTYQALRVYLQSLISGELTQFNRQAGGAIVQHSAVISANGVVVSGPAILYSIKVVTAGTNITVYDNTSAAGTAVITTENTATAGSLIYPAGAGVGVLMTTGIYCSLTLGTYIFNYVGVA